jgi:hypothetical protein
MTHIFKTRLKTAMNHAFFGQRLRVFPFLALHAFRWLTPRRLHHRVAATRRAMATSRQP